MQDDAAALETLEKASKDDYRCMELKAQLLYRAERFDEASKIFMYLFLHISSNFIISFQLCSSQILDQLISR